MNPAKKIKVCLSTLLLLLLSVISSTAEKAPGPQSTIVVTGQSPLNGKSLDFIADSSVFDKHRTELVATDPFASISKPRTYSGIPFEALLKAANQSVEYGITIIGSDQYTCRIKKSMLLNSGGIIADRINGKPISEFQGGPFMVMFPDEAGIHPGRYVWHVSRIVVGTFDNPSFTINIDNKIKTLTLQDTVEFFTPNHNEKLLIPMGISKITKRSTRLEGFYLSELLESMEIEGSSISFIPKPGKIVTFKASEIDTTQIFLACRSNGEPIHPSQGGPFSLIFGAGAFRKRQDSNQSIPALFFLQQIKIEPNKE